MDPQTPASFIPKKSLDTSARARNSGALGGLLFLVGVFLFIVSIVAAGATFAYKGYLVKSIADKSASLQKTKEAFDLSAIENLLRIDLRIKQAGTLLQRHVAASAIFSFLSLQTLQNLQFTSFNYALQDDGSAEVELEGIAAGFSTVALQSDQFAASKALKDIVFSDIAVDPQGKVTFTVTATVDPSLINYGKNLNMVPGAAVQPQATTTPIVQTTVSSSTPSMATSSAFQ